MTKKSKVSIILSGLAVGGVALTAFLSAKRSFKYEDLKYDTASKKWDKMSEEEFQKNKDKNPVEILDKKDNLIIFGKTYWPALLSGTITIGCIIGSQVLSLKEIAAISAAFGVVGAKYKDVQLYLQENFPETYEKVQSAIENNEIVNSIEDKHIEETYDGRQRYYGSWSKQVFYATDAEIKEAECAINERMINEGYATLFDYLATFPKSSGIKLEDWMKFIGWYEGCGEDGNETTYCYNTGFFGNYIKPTIEMDTVDYQGDKIDVNVIRWDHVLDFDPELDNNEMACLEDAMAN